MAETAMSVTILADACFNSHERGASILQCYADIGKVDHPGLGGDFRYSDNALSQYVICYQESLRHGSILRNDTRQLVITNAN